MIYWNIASIPELAKLSSEERQKIWRSYYWKVFKTKFAPMTALITIVALAQLGSSINESFGHFIGGTIGGFLFWQVMMESIHACIKDDDNFH